MNLYDFHDKSEELHKHSESEIVPEIFWNKYSFALPPKAWQAMLKRKEKYLAKDAKYAFKYARYLKKRWPEGEAAIATNAHYATRYAIIVLNKPFPEAEETIAKSDSESQYYLGQFPERKEAIEKLK